MPVLNDKKNYIGIIRFLVFLGFFCSTYFFFIVEVLFVLKKIKKVFPEVKVGKFLEGTTEPIFVF